MQCNVGKVDRLVRMIVGVAIIVGGIGAHSKFGFLGVILVASGLIGWCGLYKLFGYSTDKEE